MIFTSLSSVFFSTHAQNFESLSFGTDNTLDIITWNIEHFPKNGQTTIDYVTDIIENLDADIIAIQEVSNTSSFNQMMNNLSDYTGNLESVYFRGLAYIYKTDVIEINDIHEIYTTSEYWSYFPRNPMVIDFNYKGERYVIINNHLKCCGDGTLNLNNSNDEETRRYHASRLLKEYIDTNLSDVNIILVGDLNDSITDDIQHNVFRDFIEDSNNFIFTDTDIANGSNSNWSFPTWPSHLDHILITNELFEEFQNSNSSIEVIKLEDYFTNGWSQYDSNVTDHRPVGLKLYIDSSLSIDDVNTSTIEFKNYPNPFKSETIFTFNASNTIDKIDIYSITGKKVKTLKVNPNQTKISWKVNLASNGIYFAKLISNNKSVATTKLVVIK